METEETQSSNEDFSQWNYVPDFILLQIFQYLNAKELLTAGLTCNAWNRVSYDELLWKYLLYRDFNIDTSIPIAPGKSSWYEEYKRLTYCTPTVCSEILYEHGNQVLHVSCSHDGTMFATSSKDGYIIVWNSRYPAKVKFSHDMKVFSWKYTQFSQFNQTDTLLLVSGVHFGSPNSTSGEIAVFSLQGGFNLQCRVGNKPYDIFGTWYSDRHLLSGDLHWLAHLVSSTGLWINKASQETSSEHTPILNQLFTFYNTNASSVRAVMVADCPSEKQEQSTDDDLDTRPSSSQGTRNLEYRRDDGGSDPIRYCSLYRRAQVENKYFVPNEVENQRDEASSVSSDYEEEENVSNETEKYLIYTNGSTSRQPPANQGEEFSPESSEYDEDEDLADQPEKLLIFTTGSKTYTPHQIGFKKIKGVKFPKVIDPGPSLKERIAERERLLAEATSLNEPDWLNYKAVADRFDKIDRVIDLHGHIIGMGLSPDHRYLYVNSRPWPIGYRIANPLDPPPIAQEIDIHVIDLTSFKEVGKMLRSHKAYTPNNECFFIFLDVSDDYVASGAEDKHGYLWDRHYGVCLAKFPHADVVNSVAFNPVDPGMLITTSDDFVVKVWRSRAFVKKTFRPELSSQLVRALSLSKQSKSSVSH